MATTWNWDLLDEHLATDISKFTSAVIPELAARHPESEHWVANYFLNSVLRAQFEPPTREYAFVLLRRTMAAFEEYELARTKTYEYLELRANGLQPTRIYLSALHHWEQCVAHAWQAFEACRKLTKTQVFVKGDGSPEEKLHHVYNRSKHSDKAIMAFADQMPQRGPLPVWMSNDGLRSVQQLLTWTELSDVLDNLAEASAVLQDPTTFLDAQAIGPGGQLRTKSSTCSWSGNVRVD